MPTLPCPRPTQIRSRAELRSYFETGLIPTECDFADVFESFVHVSEGGSSGWELGFLGDFIVGDSPTGGIIFFGSAKLPWNANELVNMRLSLLLAPADPSNDVTLLINVLYYSDIQNSLYDNIPVTNGFKHLVVQETFSFDGSVGTSFIDEIIRVNLNLNYNSLQSLLIVGFVGNAVPGIFTVDDFGQIFTEGLSTMLSFIRVQFA
jgi:hypothetical protein